MHTPMGSISQVSSYSGTESRDIDLNECSDAEFLNHFKYLDELLRETTLENKFLIKYLIKYGALDENEMEEIEKQQSEKSSSKMKTSLFSSSFIGSKSTQSLASDRVSRKKRSLSIILKIDLLCEVMEFSQTSYMDYTADALILRSNQIAECEEAKMTGSEVRQVYDSFIQGVVVDGYDPLTQRVPAEKFIRFMDEWTKKAQMALQKLILHTGSEQLLLKKLKIQYVDRSRLAENIHSVDYDQLVIENKNLHRKLDSTVSHIKKLKTINGWANVILNQQRNNMRTQKIRYDELQRKIQYNKNFVEILRDEAFTVEKDKQEVLEQLSAQKQLMETYNVPDTMEYVNIKAKLFDSKQKLTNCLRTNSILKITLSACAVQMKSFLKTKIVKPEWFKSPTDEL